MHVPTAEELAAIAAAYVVAARRSRPPARNISRWALADRLDTDVDALRGVAAGAHRWTTAARLDTA